MTLEIILAIGALGAAAAVIRKGWIVMRKVSRFIDEVVGKPAEHGRPPVPGIVQKVDQIAAEQTYMRGDLENLHKTVSEVRHEVFPNSGGSLRDAIDRLEQREAYWHPPAQQRVDVHVNPDND